MVIDASPATIDPPLPASSQPCSFEFKNSVTPTSPRIAPLLTLRLRSGPAMGVYISTQFIESGLRPRARKLCGGRRAGTCPCDEINSKIYLLGSPHAAFSMLPPQTPAWGLPLAASSLLSWSRTLLSPESPCNGFMALASAPRGFLVPDGIEVMWSGLA